MLYLILASLIWGTTPIVAKLAYAQGISPLALVEVRLVVGALLFAFYLRSFRMEHLLSKELLALALLGLAANFLFYHLAVKHTSAAAAQVLESTSVAFAALFAYLLREERLSQRKLLAITASLAGSALIFYSHASGSNLFGDTLAILAALTWALFTVLASRLLASLREEEVLLLVFTIAALALLPFAAASPVITLNGALIAFAMGAVHTFLAYLLYFRGIARAKAIAASIAFALSPVVAIALSALLLHEMLTPAFYAGAALIIGGILVARAR
jgi:drug/metabolite transporter (DMT)-like permease